MWRFLYSQLCYVCVTHETWFWVKARFIHCCKLTLLLTFFWLDCLQYMCCCAHWLQHVPNIHPDWIYKLKINCTEIRRLGHYQSLSSQVVSSVVLDIVFFGESLPSEFYHNLDEDSEKVYLYDTRQFSSNNFVESSHSWGNFFWFHRPDVRV